MKTQTSTIEGNGAVRRGRKIGVFASWAKCEPLVRGFPRAEYKSFWSLEEARAYFLEGKAAEIYEYSTPTLPNANVILRGRQGVACLDGPF
jgi:viroplasmin and RNaseH domain-containing protein